MKNYALYCNGRFVVAKPLYIRPSSPEDFGVGCLPTSCYDIFEVGIIHNLTGDLVVSIPETISVGSDSLLKITKDIPYPSEQIIVAEWMAKLSTKEEMEQELAHLLKEADKKPPLTQEERSTMLAQLSHQADINLIKNLTASTPEEIETAITVVHRLNYAAAYGRNPDLCGKTKEVLDALSVKLDRTQGTLNQ